MDLQQDDELYFEIGAGVVEPGTYEPATLHALETKTITATNSETGDAEQRQIIEWVFALEDGREVKGVTSTKTGPGAKAQEWIAGLLGVTELAPHSRYGRADLVGREARIEVAWDARNARFTRVVDVLPLTQ